jgi:hypothetical protein
MLLFEPILNVLVEFLIPTRGFGGVKIASSENM